MTEENPLATPTPWNLLASAYEAEVLPSFRHFAEESLRLAAPPPGAPLADVACGPGTLALLAASRGFAVDALDLSPEMIALLERSARERGLDGVRARVGDGQALPYPDGGHGAAFSLFGLMFFPDRGRGFSELRRILRPGARAVISSWQPIDQSPALAGLLAALEHALPAASAPPRQMPPLVTAEACRTEMERSFDEVEVRPVSTRFPSGRPRPCGNRWSARCPRSWSPGLASASRPGPRISGRVRDSLANRLGTGPVTLDLHAWLSVGTARERRGASV